MFTKYLNAAIDVVRKASLISKEIQKTISSENVISKSDLSPVTVADYSVQAIISLHLIRLFGKENFKLVAEEDSNFLQTSQGKDCLERVTTYVNQAFESDIYTEQDIIEVLSNNNNIDTNHDYWVLDPIDGTKGFIRKQYYAIGLAYIHNHTPFFGIISSPNLSFSSFSSSLNIYDSFPKGCIFVAQQSSGVKMIDLDTHISRAICCHDIQSVSDAVFVTSYERGHSNVSILDSIKQELNNNTQSIYIDSMTKYCLVARGDAHVYYRYKPTNDYKENVWDHAAGYIIAKESGLIVTDILNKEIDFSTGKKLSNNHGILVSSPSIRPQVMNAIHKVIFPDM
ncbi:hypothetical protein WA158_008292 [Blastocystis sp. Blastoise]